MTGWGAFQWPHLYFLLFWASSGHPFDPFACCQFCFLRFRESTSALGFLWSQIKLSLPLLGDCMLPLANLTASSRHPIYPAAQREVLCQNAFTHPHTWWIATEYQVKIRRVWSTEDTEIKKPDLLSSTTHEQWGGRAINRLQHTLTSSAGNT